MKFFFINFVKMLGYEKVMVIVGVKYIVYVEVF